VIDLLDAVSLLRGNWSLHYVGDGPERKTLEKKAVECGIQKRTQFMGFLTRSQVVAALQSFDVLVLPSRSTPHWKEQFGLVLAEAMLCNIAVVGSNSGAISEVIDDVGLIFPEGDVEALASQLQRLHDDPQFRAELAARGRQRALEKYSTTAMAHQFEMFVRSFSAK
jgi:glycosyltransferase involved in cell wall biosynthesis